MPDLGNVLGSLMSGLLRARRMADEQTAALAEYYKDNPLLEGLSVPRIRIPELTIDMPFLVEDQVEGVTGEMEDPLKITDAVELQMKETLAKLDITASPSFHKAFAADLKNSLATIKQSETPVMKETIARSVQDAFASAVTRSKIPLTGSQKETIARDLRAGISKTGMVKKPLASSIIANIKTADIKDKASAATVVRLKITLKEEGLEWIIQASETGGLVRTLQPE